MKHFLSTVLCLFAFSTLPAQSPVYVLFNANCIDQLEYRYTRSGESVFAYSIRPNADEQYIFMSGKEGLPTDRLPEGTFTCNNLNLNGENGDEAVRIINQQTSSRQMYVVIQRPNDYLMMPIYSATQIKRYGSWYLVVGSKYTFAIDTMKLSYQDNLQSESSPSIIRFTGSKLANCRYQYGFHGEPTRGFSENMDFDFIYGVGVVNSRIGSTATELDESEMKLVGVNGLYFDNYMASICPQYAQPNNNTTSTWTNPANYNYYNEPDKEAGSSASAGKWGAPNQYDYSSSSTLINCPTQPGSGYHIVQPGQSLKAIARTYNVDLKSVIKWNKIKNPDHIEVCQQIWLQKPPANANTTSKDPGVAQYNYDNTQGFAPTVPSQATYWNQGGNNYAPAAYNYNNTTQAGVYYVQKGETLFGIAKRYGCAEECFRRANNFPLEGNVNIKAGQALIVPECTCQTSGNTTKTGTTGYRSVPSTPPQVAKVLNNQTQPQSPESPVVYNYPDGNVNYFNETSVAGRNPGTRSAAPAQQQNQEDLPPTQEYIVRQGETVNSIAIKHRMSISELANLNSIAMDEKLTPGKRLIVRRYQN